MSPIRLVLLEKILAPICASLNTRIRGRVKKARVSMKRSSPILPLPRPCYLHSLVAPNYRGNGTDTISLG